jgi:predicted GIY-YIG superfamily endonuclease
MTYCSNCGTLIEEQVAIFCPNCGTRIIRAPAYSGDQPTIPSKQTNNATGLSKSSQQIYASLKYNYRDVFNLPSGASISIKSLLWLPESVIWEENNRFFVRNNSLQVKALELSRACYFSYRTLSSQRELKHQRHIVYVLECQTPAHFYIGMTSRFTHRIAVHKEGKASSFTKKHGVKSVIHTEEAIDGDHALERVRELMVQYRAKYGYENVSGTSFIRV